MLTVPLSNDDEMKLERRRMVRACSFACRAALALAVSFCLTRRSDSSFSSWSAFAFLQRRDPRVRLRRDQLPAEDIAEELLLRVDRCAL